jgi:spore maturation protein CgeB
MHVVLLCHSLVSDWNHGNAHFLRGVVRELKRRGHTTDVYEPRDGWSRTHLTRELGRDAEALFRACFPDLNSTQYGADGPDLDAALDGADLVLVHEWTDPALIARIGRHRVAGGRYRLLFHDTHHRAVSDRENIAALDLDGYDGVLAFGEAIREIYLRQGWARRVWTWHEAADTALFHPVPWQERHRDLVWIGNWGDDERSAELDAFLLRPIRTLRLDATIHGVRYPETARTALEQAGAEYGGYLPNHHVPFTFAQHKVTVHVPRRQYVQALPGIPTIRVFEALACGIPLVSSPWSDTEGLFGRDDFLIARDGDEMTGHIRALLADDQMRATLAANGLARIRARHTCAHRVDELLAICDGLDHRAPAAAIEEQALAEAR